MAEQTVNKIKEWIYNLVLSVIVWLCLFKILDRMTDLMSDIIQESAHHD